MNEDQLRSKAKDVYDERCELSTIFSKEAEHRIPKFYSHGKSGLFSLFLKQRMDVS